MNPRNDKNKNSRIPQNDPSKAMDSKKEVENSNDEKTDQDFPGYPHYPAKEDIMDQRTDSHRVDMNMEKLSSGPNNTGVNQRFMADQNRTRGAEGTPVPLTGEDDELAIRMGTEADVNEDDIAVLNSANDETTLPRNTTNVTLESDLDVPGAELDDANENIGEEDEENNYYSLGGDRHEGQEEDPYSDPTSGM